MATSVLSVTRRKLVLNTLFEVSSRLSKLRYFKPLVILGAAGFLMAAKPAPEPQRTPAISGRIVAVGVTGASAISQVGRFHPGGVFFDKKDFAVYTGRDRLLEPERLLVASSSNFGAPLGRPDLPPGSILSIDPRGSQPLVISENFAADGHQSTAWHGRVQVYTAQTPAFLNSIHNPNVLTASFPAVSNPLAISINNAFGRPWFASAPKGASAPGLESVTDPDGRPFAKAPSITGGGVFAGDLTNRPQQFISGEIRGAVGTAFLGRAPDQSGRATFVVVNADGSVVQINTEKGIDGLAPPGTIEVLKDSEVLPRAGVDNLLATRAGVIFNWVPDRVVYIADPKRNAIQALTLTDDQKVIRVESKRVFTSPALSSPVDLAPVVPEVANPAFSSNTTLAGASDFYVANRGNGTIVRMRQDGSVVATRKVTIPGAGELGPGRINGIAVSSDAQRIWITVSGALGAYPKSSGTVVELPAFGAPAFANDDVTLGAKTVTAKKAQQ
jgi:hypothetical protein